MSRSVLPALLILALVPGGVSAQGEKKADPVTGEATPAPKPKEAAAKPAEEPKPAAAATVAPTPQKLDPKLFDEALNDYFTGNPKEAAARLFTFTENVAATDENYAWAQFFNKLILLFVI